MAESRTRTRKTVESVEQNEQRNVDSTVTRYESDQPTDRSVYGTRRQDSQLVFFDGQTPDRETARSGGVREQTRDALDRVRTMAAESGLEPDDLLRTTVYLAEMDELPAVKRAYAEFFDGQRPSRTVVGVSSLPNDAAVQIEATGVKR
ncbi:RidA family protein [Haloarcula sp. Atlit-7R]|uniref:RidA family protein n=1 Tax=Haloarcula sp. Atlit-7R TaxID=2282125 RepID=UPI000EF16D85|nr:RidA family protein [Haloarcula sp. Atlit-7R]RLM96605.1 RidA family protein [Haloarcula sp. Atlit-7R]